MTGLPRYEYRFANGDIFFTDSALDAQLKATANLIADHEKKVILKDRSGTIGPDGYAKLFPPQKHVNVTQFSIVADVRLEQNGADLEVWSGEELLSIIRDGGNNQFDVWRLLNRLAQVKNGR